MCAVWLAALLLGLPATLVAKTVVAPTASRSAVVLDIRDAIGPATSRYFIQTLQAATRRNAALVVMQLDTPGGLDTAMRDMVQAILASPVPVVVFVAPSGARAASAGTFLLYASHVAAMAPATNLGAATPISIIGGGGGSGSGSGSSGGAGGADNKGAGDNSKDTSAANGTALEHKAINDAVAYLRSLAELRHRNADWAELAVRQAASLSASEALKQHVVDVIATDLTDLLSQLDGRKLTTVIGEVTLATRSLQLVYEKPDWRVQLLSVLTNPNVAYLLLLIGIYGLLLEGYNPGAVLPGTAGAIALLLALYSFQILSVNYAGLALILLGVGLLATEAIVHSFGALGIGGVIAFVMGSIMLLDREVPGFAIARPLIAAMGLVSAVFALGIVTFALRSRLRPVVTGVELLRNETAIAVADFADSGLVQVRGELWQAVSAAPVSIGQRLRILQVDGLTLHVGPAI
jgi:membrane-bound serine protease (ClpP class)